jgi:hypothetical protein
MLGKLCINLWKHVEQQKLMYTSYVIRKICCINVALESYVEKLL